MALQNARVCCDANPAAQPARRVALARWIRQDTLATAVLVAARRTPHARIC
jgi:hypothetical protein